MNGRARRVTGYATAALTLSPALAQAHLLTTGLGPVYDGMSHFALSPDEVLPVAALSLLAGLYGPTLARVVLFALPTAWVGGALIAAFGGSLTQLSGQVATAALFLLVGGIGVTEAFRIGGILRAGSCIPRIGVVAAASVLGLMRGNLDLTAFIASGPTFIGPSALNLCGVVITAFVLTALAASLSLPLESMWARITVCVTGSWSAALGLLLIGWSIHEAMIAPHQAHRARQAQHHWLTWRNQLAPLGANARGLSDHLDRGRPAANDRIVVWDQQSYET